VTVHCFTVQHRISHADVDFLGELKLSALLGLLEQSAVEASSDAGLDPAWYTRAGRFWLIRRTRLERWLAVGGGDVVAVETHVADWRRARSLRRYEVRLVAPGVGVRARPVEGDDRTTARLAGALVARATTDWVYCDIATGRPVSIPEDVRAAFSGDSGTGPLPRAAALPDRGEGEAVALPLAARVSQLDHVTHVNNAAYAGFLEDGAFELFAARGLPLDRMLALGGALRPRSLDLEYLVDALAGDELDVASWVADGALDGSADAPPATTQPVRLLQTITRRDGTRLVRAGSEWIWRRRPAILGGVPEDEGPEPRDSRTAR